MENLLNYAARELRYLRPEEANTESFQETLTYLLQVFAQSKIGKNGSVKQKTALIGTFCRLANLQPISRLTGDEDEWQPVCHSEIAYVNRRCPDRIVIFADDPTTAYDTEARVFSYDRGKTWVTCHESMAKIEFPYRVPGRPKRIYLGPGDTPEAWLARNIERGRVIG